MPDGWTISEAMHHLHPPMKRRELARLLNAMGVPPVGTLYGRKGRRPRVYPIRAILQAHAAWVRAGDTVGTSVSET